jgi:dihydrolipoamide dehydrogenase
MKRLKLDDGQEIAAEKILIASGGRPRIPDIEGLNGTDYITSDEALRLKKQPEVMTILGGGYIAIELGHFYGSLGTWINIVQHHNLLIPNEDEEIAKAFTEIFRRKYNVVTGYEPVKVAKKGNKFEVTVKSAKGDDIKTLVSDQLLVVTGREPNSDELDITKTDVELNKRGFVVTDEFMETNIKGIFALGDAVGHFLFKHSANLEAEYDFNNILNPEQKVPVDYSAMPHAIFSSPQIAGVGKTEQELKKDRVPYAVGKYDYINTGMGEAIEDKEGFVKFLVAPESGKILGCHIMGSDASTLIHEVLVAMKSGDGTVHSITRTIHIHPALSEVVQRAAGNIQREEHSHQ